MHFHLPSMIHLPSSIKSKLERKSRDRSVSNASTVSTIFSRNSSPAGSRSSSPAPLRNRIISKPIPIATCEPSTTASGRPYLTLATPHRRPSLFENLLDGSASMGFSASPQSVFSQNWDGDEYWREGEDGVWTGGDDEKEFRSVLEPRPVKHVWAGVFEVVELSEKRSVAGTN